MNLADFNPNFKLPHVEPILGNDGATDFPMEKVIRRLDGESNRQDHEMNMSDLGEALHEVFVWMTKTKARDQRAVKSIGIKVIAAAWVMNPALFGNAPAHMVTKSFGISPQSLKTKTADFSRVFKIRNHFQVHDWQNPK